MKKKTTILKLILMAFLVFPILGCGKKELESVTVPDPQVEQAPTVSEAAPQITEPETEEIPEDPIDSEEEPETTYPYWWELSDHNAAQEVLAPDGPIKNLTIQPGNQPNELYITWFSQSSSRGKVTFKTEGLFSAISAHAQTEPSISVPNYYRNSALIQGLESNTSYTYHVSNGTHRSPDYTYNTGELNAADFTFTIAGDPEIGLGEPEELPGQRNVWRLALNRMKEQIPESSFLITTGDQVAKADSAEHYDYFLDNSVLYSTPLVPLVGNHDVGSGFFGDHFTLPNSSPLGTSQGRDGDYWFTRGNALFMVINTLTVMEKDIHEQFVAETIAANPDAKWRIIVSHYSPITMVENYQGTREEIRYTFAYMEELFDIDLFISGHDHIYTRGYFLDIDGDPILPEDEDEDELIKEYHNPEHAVYTIYNCATNSLLREPTEDYPWSMVSVQNNVPQLSVANVTENSFTITTYDADSWTEVDSFTIYKD